MPKKSKKGKNSKNKGKDQKEQKLIEKTDGQAYARVVKKLGNGRFTVRMNMSDTDVIARVCGKLRYGRNKRKNWVEENSYVLVNLREFQEDHVDIVGVYNPDEVRKLKKMGEIIEETNKRFDDEIDDDEEIGFDFAEI